MEDSVVSMPFGGRKTCKPDIAVSLLWLNTWLVMIGAGYSSSAITFELL
ncbi:unnamed protein product [Rhodiola kirilowii]